MSERRVLLQPGYVLHQRAYRDTSALVELFTPEHGRVGVVAKGVRSAKSRWRGVLQVFQPLLLSWNLRGDLGTMTGVEAQGPALMLAPERYASGFYLNEILMRLLTRHDPQVELFGYYDVALRELATIKGPDSEAKIHLESLLRKFELHMLAALGYGLVLDHDIQSGEVVNADKKYVYLFEHGPIEQVSTEQAQLNQSPGYAPANPHYPDGVRNIHGQTLLALQVGDLSHANTRREAKQLLRAVLGRYLGNKPLLSRELMQPAAQHRQATVVGSGENTQNVRP